MLEIIRYALALVVANTHLGMTQYAWPGWQAVFAFYTLSGYLITRVLQERYGFAVTGTGAFLVNRLLRLWPAYLVVIAGTALAMRFYPLDKFFFSITVPHTLLDKVTLVTVIGQTGFDFNYLIPLSRLAPTSWSLSIELCCYCLLAFYFAKTPTRLIALVIVGTIAIALSSGYCWAVPSPYYGPYCFQNRYGVIEAGFIPFAAGGLLYFYRARVRPWIGAHWRWLLTALLAGEGLVMLSTFVGVTLGPFFGVFIMGAILCWDGGEKPTSKAIDFIGRASYHLFIAHMSIAAVLFFAFGLASGTFRLFAASVLGALALSALLVPLEWRINHLRRNISARVKGLNAAVATASAATLPLHSSRRG